MKFSAEVICDSISPADIRLTTFRLVLPRFILPEYNTHRVISKNAKSSRAVPFTKMLEEVQNYPFIPQRFNANAPGMQGGNPLDPAMQKMAEQIWLIGRDEAIRTAKALNDLGISKQYVNRVLEPWSWSTIVATGTDWSNFYALRRDTDAQPEFKTIADLMHSAMEASEPRKLQAGEWHIPFIRTSDILDAEADRARPKTEHLIVRSVARCARTSYNTNDGMAPSFAKDLDLYNRLLNRVTKHSSPAEHQAMATGDPNIRSGNFRSWVQYRQTLKGHTL